MPHPTPATEALWTKEIATVVRPVRWGMTVREGDSIEAAILALVRRAYEEGKEGMTMDTKDDYIRAHATVAEVNAMRGRISQLESLLNTPLTDDWFEGVRLEAAHQIERWGSAHDDGKAPLDWFWLIGFLAQKAAMSQMAGDTGKALHHTISTAATLLNWHRAITGESVAMRPGIEALVGKRRIP